MKRFRRIARLAVGAVLFLVLVGGLVRMTGSGMGCPDWPTCFGKIIPPTNISQLPLDYKTRFAVQNKEIADFDAVKTWIEYINRLIGVLLGVIALACVAFAIPIRKQVPNAFRWSLIGLFFVVLAGGVGAVVVKTDLHEGIITLHMVIALLSMLAYLMATFSVARREHVKSVPIPQSVWLMTGLLIAFTLSQIIMGTQVREQVDIIAKALGESNRSSWVEKLTGVYDLHKVFHYGVFLVLIGLMVQLRPLLKHLTPAKNMLVVVFILLATEALLGISMHNMGMPAWIQPVHLLLAALIFAAEIGALGWLILAHRQGQITQPTD
ncbi:MAG: heme A synthase [Bacteroidia bacterium]